VEVARGRADEVDGRRGLRAARADRGASGGTHANQRWLGHASAPDTGPGLASGGGERPAAVGLRLQARVAPVGLPRFAPAGWGAEKRQSAPAQPAVGKQPPQPSERPPRTLRTRRTRLGRRTLCFAQTERMHALGRGLLVHR